MADLRLAGRPCRTGDPVTVYVLRGALSGAVALFIGLAVAEVARFAGLPAWMTAGAGFWAMLIVFALRKP